MGDEVIRVAELRVAFAGRERPAVAGLSLSIQAGETCALVGESGSGKSTVALALMGLLPANAHLTWADWQFTGQRMSMVFQEPMTALNPTMRCGEQVAEAIWTALGTSRKEARLRAVQWLEQVQLPTPKDLAQRYPHELSGGQRQRVMIAMAMAREPSLLICDEPTTALDAHVQEEILDLIRDLQARHGTAVLFITHDLGVVKRMAHHVVVLWSGEVVESGPVSQVLHAPRHPYTQGLLASRPPAETRPYPLPTVSDFLEHKTVVREERPRRIPVPGEVPLLKVEGITKSFSGPVLQGLDLEIYPGETVGLVGESGSGKSTLARCLVRLEHPDGGRVWWKGQSAQEALSPRERARRIQYIFQDPFSSLPPHRTILQILDEPLRLHGSASTPAEREKKAAELLEGVGLHAQDLPKYPHQFSGGQRQRVGIARALAVQPELLVCDESVSALDVSVQAQVLNLLHELKDRFGFSILFISHDLRVVQYMADRLLVLRHGKWDAVGDPSELLHRPPTPYLKQLASHLVEE
jgi:peptide/nickel transport system ATP-binding protein